MTGFITLEFGKFSPLAYQTFVLHFGKDCMSFPFKMHQKNQTSFLIKDQTL